MITYEVLIKKLAQKKQKRKFMHKTRYGKMGEAWGYDMKSHIEEYNRLKDNPDALFKDYMQN